MAGGRQQIALRRRATVTDELTGEVLGRAVTSVELEVPVQRTIWLRLDPQ